MALSKPRIRASQDQEIRWCFQEWEEPSLSGQPTSLSQGETAAREGLHGHRDPATEGRREGGDTGMPALASNVQEGILPAKSCCPTCFHTLLREKAFYKAIYFSQNTPPVNKIPQSPTFKLGMPPLPFPGEGGNVSGRTSEAFRRPGAGERQARRCPPGSRIAPWRGLRGCVPAPSWPCPVPRLPLHFCSPGSGVPWPPAHLLTP